MKRLLLLLSSTAPLPPNRPEHTSPWPPLGGGGVSIYSVLHTSPIDPFRLAARPSFLCPWQVVGVSVDSVFSHLAWIQTPRTKGGLGGLQYPLLAGAPRRRAPRRAAVFMIERCVCAAGGLGMGTLPARTSPKPISKEPCLIIFQPCIIELLLFPTVLPRHHQVHLQGLRCAD